MYCVRACFHYKIYLFLLYIVEQDELEKVYLLKLVSAWQLFRSDGKMKNCPKQRWTQTYFRLTEFSVPVNLIGVKVNRFNPYPYPFIAFVNLQDKNVCARFYLLYYQIYLIITFIDLFIVILLSLQLYSWELYSYSVYSYLCCYTVTST